MTDAHAVLDHPLGVYFDLDDAAYHADVALGSGDIRRLAVSPFDFWWESRFNPNRKPEELTPALIVGRAVHTAVLEGRSKFEKLYGPTDFSGATKDGKAERERLAKFGMTPLKREDYDSVLLASTMIRANPHLADAFQGGAPEVSVFWERDGIKRKCRFDFLKPRAIVDLKSIRNARDIDFREACRRRFAEGRFDVQAAHYREGRIAMRDLVAAGAVSGNVDHDLLRKAIAAGSQFAFVYVYWQAEGAPLTWATMLSPENPIIGYGRATIDYADRNWLEFKDRFGLSTPWVLAERIEELDQTELPPWYGRR